MFPSIHRSIPVTENISTSLRTAPSKRSEKTERSSGHLLFHLQIWILQWVHRCCACIIKTPPLFLMITRLLCILSLSLISRSTRSSVERIQLPFIQASIIPPTAISVYSLAQLLRLIGGLNVLKSQNNSPPLIVDCVTVLNSFSPANWSSSSNHVIPI